MELTKKKQSLKEIRLARNLNATHLAITHFDEISNATKLWLFCLSITCHRYAFVMVKNVTGDFFD